MLGRPDPDDATRHQLAARATVPTGEKLRITTHCVDRFWERAAVGCTTFRAARARLVQLVETVGEVQPSRPGWTQVADGSWLALGPDIGLVLNGKYATTCLARGGLPDGARRHRNLQRRKQRRRRARERRDGERW